MAGELASFRVRFADEHGAPAAAEQLTLVLSPQGADLAQSPGLIYCGVAGGVDGGQTASFSVRRAGDYALTVQLRGSGAVLAGSPFALRVLAAAPYAQACELACEGRSTEQARRREGEGEALHTPKALHTSEALHLVEALHPSLHPSAALACGAGERLRLRLHVRDRWGNACEVEAVGPLTSQVEAGGGRCEVGGVERGGMRLAWTAVRRGGQSVAVRVGGEHVKGSPLLLSVAGGVLAAARCEVHGGPRRLVAGEVAQAAVAGEALQLVAGDDMEMRVTPCDAHANPLRRDEAGQGRRFGMVLLPAAEGGAVAVVGGGAGGEEVGGEWAGDECVMTQQVRRAGRCVLHAWCEGEDGGEREALGGSPWVVEVRAAAAEAEASTVEGCTSLAAGESMAATVVRLDNQLQPHLALHTPLSTARALTSYRGNSLSHPALYGCSATPVHACAYEYMLRCSVTALGTRAAAGRLGAVRPAVAAAAEAGKAVAVWRAAGCARRCCHLTARAAHCLCSRGEEGGGAVRWRCARQVGTASRRRCAGMPSQTAPRPSPCYPGWRAAGAAASRPHQARSWRGSGPPSGWWPVTAGVTSCVAGARR